MTERSGLITMKGNPLTLLGHEVNKGDDAPDVVLVGTDLSEVALSSLKGKTVILSVVPSLDTGVCDTQTKRFNKEAASLGDDVRIVTISMDLPFAQKRWCGSVDDLDSKCVTLSDYRAAAFGETYGVLIKELRLLARSLFVVNKDGKVVHKEIVPEVTSEPDYDSAIEAVKQNT